MHRKSPVDDHLKFAKKKMVMCYWLLRFVYDKRLEVKGFLMLTVAGKDTTLHSIHLVTILLMAYAVTSTTIIQLTIITKKHPSH